MAYTPRAFIFGPHAQLIRYAQPAERANGALGLYDTAEDTAYDWPGLPSGALVDLPYTKFWLTDALLQYFQVLVGGTSDISKLANYSNRIRSAALSFAANGTAYPRSAAFLRDVLPGDVVLVEGLDQSSNPQTLWTYVQQVLGTTVAAVVDAATADAGNAATQSATTTITQLSGDINCVTAAANGSAYIGTVSGNITETYDILVTTGSVSGNFTTATVRILSGSGTDDVVAVTPAAAGVPFAVGTRGATATFSLTDTTSRSESAVEEHVAPHDLIVGQRWHMTVHQAFTAPTPTAGGAYSGAGNTTYVVTVTQGGAFSAPVKPQIVVTTTTGSDASGPTNVTAAGTPVTIGTAGVTLAFAGTALCAGDRYYVDVVAAGVGAESILVLGHSLDANISAGTLLDVTLFIHQPLLQVPAERVSASPALNWTATQDAFTVNTGLVATDPSWQLDGEPVWLPVVSETAQDYGELFLETRYWLNDLCGDIYVLSSPTALSAAISGVVDPDNPLLYGVSLALAASNGADLRYTAVCNPDDPASWQNALTLASGRIDTYNLVPLTQNQTVIDACQVHCAEESTAENKRWCKLFFALTDIPEIPIVSAGSTVLGHTQATTSDGAVALATITQDPNVLDTAYTLVTNTSANAKFVTNGVLAGDVFRAAYATDGFGNVTYSSFVVASVVSETELLLAAGPGTAVNMGARFEVWRTLTAAQEAAAIAAYATGFADPRVCAVWPDQYELGATEINGMYLCCILAGTASGILAQQSLTNLPLAGITTVRDTTHKFNSAQLDVLAAGGVLVVTQDLSGLLAATPGTIYVRDALTTAAGSSADLNVSKEMSVRNIDSVNYQLLQATQPFYGQTNVSPVITAQLRLTLQQTLKALTSGGTSNTGPQLVTATIVSVAPSILQLDQYVISITASVPYAIDDVLITLVI